MAPCGWVLGHHDPVSSPRGSMAICCGWSQASTGSGSGLNTCLIQHQARNPHPRLSAGPCIPPVLRHEHRSATTLKRLRGEWNYIDYLITWAPVDRWHELGNERIGNRKNEQCKDLNLFDKGPNVMAGRLSQSSLGVPGGWKLPKVVLLDAE